MQGAGHITTADGKVSESLGYLIQPIAMINRETENDNSSERVKVANPRRSRTIGSQETAGVAMPKKGVSEASHCGC